MFDFDGTLVDSQRSIAQSMARAFEAEGLTAPAPEAVRRARIFFMTRARWISTVLGLVLSLSAITLFE